MTHRYPGLRSFEVDDAPQFFGREAEKEAFFNLVMVEKLVVLFSKSGMGKTSLINAGLTPMLVATEYLPIYVRLNDQSRPLREQFLSKMAAVGAAFPKEKDGLTLWELLKKMRLEKDGRPAVPLLIFDQFEEIFTLYSAEKRAGFIAELADVANAKIPKPVQDELLRIVSEDPNVPDSVLTELERQPRARIVMSIRSDLLHLLNALSPQIPDILRSRFELQPLSRAAAVEAIQRPAAMPGEFASPPFLYDKTALDDIHAELSSDGAEAVESFQLQIICQNIEKKVIAAGGAARPVTPAFYENRPGIKRMLTEFYVDKIEELPVADRPLARRMVEDQLITDNERRRSVDSDDLLKSGATEALLDALVEQRILRKEPRLGTFYYEISHDTLVAPILVKRKERREEEARLAELALAERARREAEAALHAAEKQAEADRLAKEEAVAARVRARRIAIAAVFFGLAALAACLWAWQLTGQVSGEKQKAEAEKDNALAQKRLADSLLVISEIDRDRADSLVVVSQKNEAVAKKQTALAERSLAAMLAEQNARKAAIATRLLSEAETYARAREWRSALAKLDEAEKLGLAAERGRIDRLRAQVLKQKGQ